MFRISNLPTNNVQRGACIAHTYQISVVINQLVVNNSVTEDKRARDLRDCLLDMIIKCEHKYISTVTLIGIVLTTTGQAKYTRKMLSGQ